MRPETEQINHFKLVVLSRAFQPTASMTKIIEESFHLILPVWRLLGIFSSKTHPTFQKIKCYTLYLTMFVLVVTLTLINVIFKEDSDTTRRKLMVTYVTELTPMAFKCIPFVKYAHQIERCVYYFEHQRFTPRDDEERKIVSDCIYVCRRNTLMWSSLMVVAMLGWTFRPLFLGEYQLPLDVWLPYDPTASGSIVFYLTFIFISAAIYYQACCGTLCDPLIGGLAYHATGQLKILKLNLHYLSKHIQSESKRISVLRFKDVSEFLESCAIRHQSIQNFVIDYEECFSFSVFCQIVGCTVELCYVGIGLIVAPPGIFIVTESLLLFFCLSGQILFYCYYGTLLFEENEGFINAVYMGNWYEYDIKIRKFLIIMMERSKRPVIITAGKIVKLTLETFTSLLKTSYSLIAVLNKYQ